RIFLEGLARVLFGQRQRAVRVISPTVLIVEYVREAEACISLRIIGIVFQCLCEIRYRLFEGLAALFPTKHELSAAKKAVVSGEVGCFGVGKTLPVSRTEGHFQRLDDAARHVILDFELSLKSRS